MWIKLNLVLIFFLLFAYTFLMYYGIRDGNDNEKIVAFVILLFSVVVASGVGGINFFWKPDKAMSFKEMIKKVLDLFFEKLNKKYENRGLEWSVTENHFWL